MSKSLSEKVAELERENVHLRAGWRHDLEVLVMVAARHDEIKILEAAKTCLAQI